jgi:hypothetical protein
MVTLLTFVRSEAWCLTIAFFLLVAYQISTGKINARGLLFSKEPFVNSPWVNSMIRTSAGAFSRLIWFMSFFGFLVH